MPKKVRILSADYGLGEVGDTATVANEEYMQALMVAGAAEDADGPNSLELVSLEDGRNLADLKQNQILAAVADGKVSREDALKSEGNRKQPRKSLMDALGAE